MARDLSEEFMGEGRLADGLADYFIDGIRIRLIGCGTRTTSARRINSFMLPTFLAVVYKSGSAEIRHGAETTVLRPGSFFLFRPYDIYSGKMTGDAPVCMAFLQFDIVPFMERYHFGLSTLAAADAVFRSDRYRRFGAFLEELVGDGAGSAGRNGMLKQFAKLLAAQIVYDQAGQHDVFAGSEKGRASAVINRAYQYTADHLSEPVRIGKILEYENVSKATLEKTFRSILSTTPRRALLRFKVERSMEMLQYNNSISSIVKALGFSSVYHYSNAFKAVAGMRPTEYRRRVAGSHIPGDPAAAGGRQPE